MSSKKSKPNHPGEVLLSEFLEPNQIQQIQLAEHLGWTYARLNEIINQKRGVTADSALAFSGAFKTKPEFWLTLQNQWDLWHAAESHKPIAPLKFKKKKRP